MSLTRISSPPVVWPCFYGIDFATRAELISTSMTPEQIAQNIAAVGWNLTADELAEIDRITLRPRQGH